MAFKRLLSEARALEFAPDIVRMQEAPPSPAPRLALLIALALLAALLVWAGIGRLDVIAVAQGKLIPQTSLKIVQPAEGGIVRELLVREGDEVRGGQTLARMDMRFSEADGRILDHEIALKRLQLRRIEAELGGTALRRLAEDPAPLFAQLEAQHRERRAAHGDALGQEQALLKKARDDLAAALATQAKLEQVLPVYREQEQAMEKLHRDGFAGRLLMLERQRERIEREQDLRAQGHGVESLKASIAQSEKRLAQITSNYRSQLQTERVEAEAQLARLTQEKAKQAHRHALLELKAPQDGVVKDLATQTPGSVVAPGSVLMTLVPRDEPLRAEVWLTNADAGFVEPGQPVKVKIAAYPFQKYGMAEGTVERVSPDASELPEARSTERRRIGEEHVLPASGFRTLVALKSQHLELEARRYPLSAGMQVVAEINLGSRTVLEYLLSPVQNVAHEAGRER